MNLYCGIGGGLGPLLIVFIILVVVFVCRSIVVVHQGFEYTVERFGRYMKTLQPGLHFLLPFVERVGAKINMMENVLDVPSQDVITKDNAAVTVDGVLFFQIFDAARSVYEVSKLNHAILNLTMTNIRTVMGSMDLDALLSHREEINARLLNVVDEATGPWGTKVTRIEIKDIRPPRDLVDSMARQMKAEREKRALILEAEGKKQSAVLEAEGLRQASILKAEGQKQSQILAAESRKEAAIRDAQAREQLATAEANATRFLSEAVSQGNSQALNYFVAQKYVEAFSQLARNPNQKLVLMPMETSNLVGLLGGMGELIRSGSFADQPHVRVQKKEEDA